MLAHLGMGLRKGWHIKLISAVILIIPANCHAMQDSVLEELGRMIGGAFGGATAEHPVIQQMEVVEGDAGPVEIPEKDRAEFKDRITGYSHAMCAWVIQTCAIPEMEQPRFREVFERQVQSRMEAFERGAGRNAQRDVHQVEPFSKTTPLLFTRSSADGAEFRNAVLESLRKELLSNEQKQKLEDALKERETFRLHAIAEFLTSIADRELFLTEQQRTEMVRKMVTAKKPVQHTFYAFQPQSYYLPYEPLSQLFSRISAKDVLSPSQKKRLTDLSGSDPNNHLVFQAADGPDAWLSQMAAMSESQRSLFLRGMAVRIAWLEHELKLSAEQIEYLTVAGKGAAIRAIGDWKEQTRQTLDQMEQQMAQMGGNFGFGASTLDSSSIDQNEIWIEGLREVAEGRGWDLLKERDKKLNESVAACLVALFDDELWLTAEQRKSLQPVFANSLPKSSDPVQYYDYIRELIWLAYPLFKSDDAARSAVLSDEQNAVWQTLKSIYSFQKENNYVQIQLRNQGGSFGFMLSD